MTYLHVVAEIQVDQEIGQIQRAIGADAEPSRPGEGPRELMDGEFQRRCGDLILPPPLSFKVRFKGLRRSFNHHEDFGYLTVTATSENGQQASKRVHIILARPMEWVNSCRCSMTLFAQSDKTIPYKVRYGIGNITFGFHTTNNRFTFNASTNQRSPATGIVKFRKYGCKEGFPKTNQITVTARDSQTRISCRSIMKLRKRGDYCFGAVGSQCGPWTLIFDSSAENNPFVFCRPTRDPRYAVCWINGGSWAHDECCADHPEGFMCAAGLEGGSECLEEWGMAWWRTKMALSWSRRIDTKKFNCSGNVVRSEYCCKGGIMDKSDRGYCCSGKGHMFGTRESDAALLPELAARYAAQFAAVNGPVRSEILQIFQANGVPIDLFDVGPETFSVPTEDLWVCEP